jgi:proteasome accessory factor C
MDKFDRIFQLDAILRSRKTPISIESLQERMECTRATVFRALNSLRDRLHAPIAFERSRGYRYAPGASGSYELPGLWFTGAELQALAVIQRLINDAGGGMLEEHVRPVAKRLEELTQHKRLNLGEAAVRLRFPAIAGRPAGSAFQAAASATLQRKKLHMEYHGRERNERTVRTISPQRVTHYRESWYLDAWDEEKRALRCFAMDRILHLEILKDSAYDVPEDQLDAHYASAYGIFGGEADQTAVLRFTAERARWVADEQWHPKQEATWRSDGSYELRIPYRDPRELVMDILRHGRHVKVVAPGSLMEEVRAQLRDALTQY